jgi:putative PIN family toxin of toxin-antitoxin system
MRVVLDANIFVSALLNTHGAPKQIDDRWRDEAFELLTSDAILAEIERVLNYPKIAALHQLTDSERREFLTLLREESHVISYNETLHVSPDESDNRYLECATGGGADYLVTGDKKHLLPIWEYQGIKIISPATFLALLKVG